MAALTTRRLRISPLVVAVVLPGPFREMGARRNFSDTRQSGHGTWSGL